jgi:hypothetical protein
MSKPRRVTWPDLLDFQARVVSRRQAARHGMTKAASQSEMVMILLVSRLTCGAAGMAKVRGDGVFTWGGQEFYDERGRVQRGRW